MKWIKILEGIDVSQQIVPDGTSKLVIIGDHRICLSNVNNQFYAIKNACPHRGQSLSEGKINYLGELVCPLHGYRFSLKTGREGDHKCEDVQTYQIRMEEKGVFILI